MKDCRNEWLNVNLNYHFIMSRESKRLHSKIVLKNKSNFFPLHENLTNESLFFYH